jgi:hypothetical protein
MVTLAADLMPARLNPDELAELTEAARLLEADGFASRLSRIVGGQLRRMGRALPAPARHAVAVAADTALKVAFRVALSSLGKTGAPRPRNRLHQAAAAATGAIGGAFGFSSTLAELPISTAILLRSVAEIARSQGEDLANPETALACMDVMGLGAERADAQASRSRYYLAREQLRQGLGDVDFVLVKQGVASEIAPMLAGYLRALGARFGVVVSEKIAAQAIPVIGALGGAAVNAAFAQHFQAMARGHFTVRRLERKHGAEAVRFEYERLRGELRV